MARRHNTGEVEVVIQNDWYVEVEQLQTGETVKRLGPHEKRKAEKILDGLSINMGEDYIAKTFYSLKKLEKVG